MDDDSQDMAGDEPTVLLLGDPVAHSVSPAMHNAALRKLDLPGRYEARRVARENVRQAIQCLRQETYLGANVTVPHKQAAMDAVDELTDLARTIGAVNTIVRTGSLLRGDNTDAPGLLDALESSLGTVPYGMRILLLGAGGAGRAAAAALLSGGPASLTIYNRDAARGQSLATHMRDRYGGRVNAVGADEARATARDVDIIVNATSAGMDGASLPLEGMRVRPGAAVYDMVYTPSPTPLMHYLACQGAHVADGLDMLVFQAARSFNLWTGHDAPVDVMREAAQAELQRRGVQ